MQNLPGFHRVVSDITKTRQAVIFSHLLSRYCSTEQTCLYAWSVFLRFDLPHSINDAPGFQESYFYPQVSCLINIVPVPGHVMTSDCSHSVLFLIQQSLLDASILSTMVTAYTDKIERVLSRGTSLAPSVLLLRLRGNVRIIFLPVLGSCNSYFYFLR